MTVASCAVLHDLRHVEGRPEDDMLRALGDISGIEIFGDQILVGVYVRSRVTKSGLVLPGGMAAEDKWQGKVSYVLKVGPDAFTEKDADRFGGRLPAPGDWIFNRAADSFQLSVKGLGAVTSSTLEEAGWPCRLIYSSDVYGRVDEPNLVV